MVTLANLLTNTIRFNFGVKQGVFTKVMLVLLMLLLMSPSTFAVIDDGVWTPADPITSNGSVNFVPVTFRVDVAGGVKSVVWLNPPLNIGDTYSLTTKDNVVYRLDGFSTYKSILNNNITNLQFQITSNDDVVTTLDVPVSIVADPAPQTAFVDSTPLVVNKGEQTQVKAQITDPGRNILQAFAFIIPVGEDPAVYPQTSISPLIPLSQFTESSDFAYLGSYYDNFERFSEAYEATGYINADSFEVEVPIQILNTIETGTYDFYVVAVDSNNQFSYSTPRALQIDGVVVDPALSIIAPTYRVPAGQPYPVSFEASHLDKLSHIEMTQTGGTSAPVSETVTFADLTYNSTGIVYLTTPITAVVDEQYSITAIVHDVNGNSTTVLASVTVGDWGERTVVVTNTASENITGDLSFANVTLTTGSTLRHIDPNIRLNNLTVDAGATIDFEAEQLHINGDLVVNGTLQTVAVYKDPDYWEYRSRGARHGGDLSYNIAYGDFKQPLFPGVGSSSYLQTALTINAQNITVAGTISSNATYGNSGGGILTLNTNLLDLSGVLSSNGNTGGAGGSVIIHADQIQGLGSISADGGEGTANGAGGRIAIYYNSYGTGATLINDGLSLHAYPGTLTSGTNSAGAGTVFLKRADQAYGELHLNNLGRMGGSTSLRSVGRHRIQSIELITGTTDQYRIAVDGFPWRIINPRSFDLGIKDLSVSLDANNPNAALYNIDQVISPIAGTALNETRSLAAAGTLGSIQLHNITVDYEQNVEFEITDANFNTHIMLFRDDGSLDTGDYLSENVNNGEGLKSYLIRRLTPGNYILAVGRYSMPSYRAVTGTSASWDTCNNCTYTLNVRQQDTNTLIVQSSTDLTAHVGNDLLGVIRLDKITAEAGVDIKTDDRLHGTIFELAEASSVVNVYEPYSSTVHNVGDISYSNQSPVFIGNVTANNITLDTSQLKVYGDLNTTGSITIQNTNYVDLNISRSGTFGAAATPESVVYEYFTLHQDAKVKITSIDPTTALSWHLFRDDGSLDSTDLLGTESIYLANRLLSRTFDLAAGNYLFAIGQYSLSSTEAINKSNNANGGNYSFTINMLESYKSTITANTISAGLNLDINDTALLLNTPAPVSVGGNLNLNSVTQPSTLTVPEADFNTSTIYTLDLNVAGQATINSNTQINVSGKGYPASRSLGFNTLTPPSHGGEGGVSNSYYARGEVYGRYYDPSHAGSGGRNTTGGGIVNLTANSILLNGNIRADGQISDQYDVGGAGGSININTPVLNGSGIISASSGSETETTSSATSASGGRIKVVATLNNFTATGTYRTTAGPQTSTNLYAQGAPGTAYIQTDNNTAGHLIVDNTRVANPQATDRRTILRSVGYQAITLVELIAANTWRISVSGTPWLAPIDSFDGLGLIGLQVDLDASNESGTLYTITDNSNNSITISTIDDLSTLSSSHLIGVIELGQLSVKGGTYLVTEDRIVLSNYLDSVIDTDSRISLGQMNNAAVAHLMTTASGAVEFTAPFSSASLSISGGNYTFSGGINITTNLTVATGANMAATTLNVDTININGGTVSANNITASSIDMTGGVLSSENINAVNINMINSAVLTTPAATTTQVYGLNINLSGQLAIDGTSMIDLNGKGFTIESRDSMEFMRFSNWRGYFDYNYARSCHAGRSVGEQLNVNSQNNIATYGEYEGCVYGFYQQPGFAGLENFGNDPGGGYLSLTANSISLDGIIRANAEQLISDNYNYEGAAGGSIAINTDTITGIGQIEARGGEDTHNQTGGYFWTGSGGRISINSTTSNSFTGTIDAGSGNAGTTGASGGAGTVYLANNNNSGDLVIDNHNRGQLIATPDVSNVATVIRDVGKHRIAAVSSLGNGQWQVTIDSNELDNVTEAGTITTPDTITYHSFSLANEQKIRISLSNVDYYHSMRVMRDDGSLTSDDYVVSSGTNSNGMDTIEYTFAAGSYIVAVGSGDITTTEVVDGVNSNRIENERIDGGPTSTAAFNYTLHIDPYSAYTWKYTQEQGLAGRSVSLNASDINSPIYPIVSNTAKSIVVDTGSTTTDLSTMVNNDLIGVHTLNSLKVQGGAYADFGNDRLILLQPLTSVIDANSGLTVGEIDKATLDVLLAAPGRGEIILNNDVAYDTLSLSSGGLQFNGSLTLSNNLNVNSSATLKANAIQAASVLLDNATIETTAITATNMDITNAGVLTVPDTYLNTNDMAQSRVYQLDLNITGSLNIDAFGSAINLDGKGYPRYYRGPDFVGTNGVNAEVFDKTFLVPFRATKPGDTGTSKSNLGGRSKLQNRIFCAVCNTVIHNCRKCWRIVAEVVYCVSVIPENPKT